MPNEHAVRKWDGGGMQLSRTLRFKGSKRYISILKEEF